MNAIPLTPTERHRTWVSIQRNGGDFCERLACAWFRADGRNKARLDHTFEHLLEAFGPGSIYYTAL